MQGKKKICYEVRRPKKREVLFSLIISALVFGGGGCMLLVISIGAVPDATIFLYFPLWLLLAAVSVGVYHRLYSRRMSPRLYFFDDGIALYEKNMEVWQYKYSDILESRLENISDGDRDYLSADIILKNRRRLTVPWGLDEARHSRTGTIENSPLMPFKMLKEKGIPIDMDNGVETRAKMGMGSLLLLPAFMLFALGLYAWIATFSIAHKSDVLLSIKDAQVKIFKPSVLRLQALDFLVAEAGSGGEIYIGTRRSGVLRFKNGSFTACGKGLPDESVDSLFYDPYRNRPWTYFFYKVTSHSPWIYRIYYLDSGYWRLFRNKQIDNKFVHHIDFDAQHIFFSTRKGFFTFSANDHKEKGTIAFPGQEIRRSFSYGGQRYVIKKITPGFPPTNYSLYKKNNGVWEKCVLYTSHEVGFYRDGSLWQFKERHAFTNLKTGAAYIFKTVKEFRFEKILLEGGIYAAGQFDSGGVSILEFKPEEETPFIFMVEKFPGIKLRDMDLDEAGTLWAIIDKK